MFVKLANLSVLIKRLALVTVLLFFIYDNWLHTSSVFFCLCCASLLKVLTGQPVTTDHTLHEVLSMWCAWLTCDICSWEVRSRSQSWSDLSVTCPVACIDSMVKMAGLIDSWKLSWWWWKPLKATSIRSRCAKVAASGYIHGVIIICISCTWW